jgi:hypothetical protein
VGIALVDIGIKVSFCSYQHDSSSVDDTIHTFNPTTSTVPSMLQANVKASPPTSSFVVHVLLFVSQKRTVPSPEQLASSNSLTGLKSTFSTPWVCPLSSIWLFGWVRSGFQTRIVLSVAPVAIWDPVAFHAIVL